jgi:hypothetical protein
MATTLKERFEEMTSEKRRERVNEYLRGIATQAVEAQGAEGEAFDDLLDDIRGDLNKIDLIVEIEQRGKPENDDEGDLGNLTVKGGR